MKFKLKKIIASFLVALVSLTAFFAAEKISDIVEYEISRFFDLRMQLSLSPTPEKAIFKIDERYEEFIEKSKQYSFTDEEMLILENFVVLERQNYMRDINRKDPELKNLMLSQKRKNDAWFKAHKKDVHNKWLYCTAADMIGCAMTWMSVFEIIRDGLNVKKYYELALKQDPYLPYAYTNLAQWHFYAPTICGGNKRKMREYFRLAVELSDTSSQKYFADLFLSQVYFEDKKYDECKALINDAYVQMPESKYIAHIKELNEKGISVFAYNRRVEDGGKGDVDLKTIAEALKQAKAEKEREEAED